MKNPESMSRTATLVEGALMVALSFVLSCIPSFSLPLGGTISFFTTLPIIIMSLRHNTKWAVGTAAVYGVLEMLQGMDNVLFLKTFGAMLLCALLDYVIAYTCLGFTGSIARKFKNSPTGGLVAGILATGFMRYLCSFVSGILLWGQYAEEGVPVWLHSLRYNALWLVPDVAIVLVAALALSKVKALHLVPQKQTASA